MIWPYREADRLACPECGKVDRFQLIGQRQSVTRKLAVRVESVVLRCECGATIELRRNGTLAVLEKPAPTVAAPDPNGRREEPADSDLPRRFRPAMR